jgi:hypothetical protein
VPQVPVIRDRNYAYFLLQKPVMGLPSEVTSI